MTSLIKFRSVTTCLHPKTLSKESIPSFLWVMIKKLWGRTGVTMHRNAME